MESVRRGGTPRTRPTAPSGDDGSRNRPRSARPSGTSRTGHDSGQASTATPTPPPPGEAPLLAEPGDNRVISQVIPQHQDHPGNPSQSETLTSFVGREDDIDALRVDLAQARLVTLLGPGGAGKTRLSQEAAESVAPAWPDGGWLAELDRGAEGERILRDVLSQGPQAGHEARPAARLLLAMWLGRSGRTAEAREQMLTLRVHFRSETMAIFEGFVLGGLAWLDNQEGLYADALARGRTALARSGDALSQMVAPQMTVIHLVTVARALAGLGDERAAGLAARLLGAGSRLLPAGHVPTSMERDNLARAKALASAVLGEAAYDSAYAEGDGLALEEAVALVDAYRE
ncbi:hypothetical protein ACWD6R_20990 [Streptomyces sp. NPDC005151]